LELALALVPLKDKLYYDDTSIECCHSDYDDVDNNKLALIKEIEKLKKYFFKLLPV
jgi:hypothetical protein